MKIEGQRKRTAIVDNEVRPDTWSAKMEAFQGRNRTERCRAMAKEYETATPKRISLIAVLPKHKLELMFSSIEPYAPS